VQTVRLVRSYRQSELWVAVAFLAGCHTGGAAHPWQPLVGVDLPPSSTPTPTPTSSATPTSTATPTPTSTSTSTATPIPTVTVTSSSPTGATEAQPVASSGADDREGATNAVARANAQLDRLRRIQRAPVHENRDSLDAAVDDLERARRDVLQDLREIELEPPGAVIRRELQRHVGDLTRALDASYTAWPPTGQAEPRAPAR
jgi:hypothetical protein